MKCSFVCVSPTDFVIKLSPETPKEKEAVAKMAHHCDTADSDSPIGCRSSDGSLEVRVPTKAPLAAEELELLPEGLEVIVPHARPLTAMVA